MWEHMFIFLFIFHLFCFGLCGYPPIGDEVQAGSVLLPASRRGRYLANIVRRQAVDGTGIKFNKDADRMNAEAKKKVDVLSEELLPYIIAEQERRTTLYKRVMTAIQNGEKGVTIAEIRNKPPAIIRKGLMYRCPTNRAPKEPDGSGVIMCEDDIDPRPIMYDSCLSAEDKELYVAENRYFFCNRHKIEGPDPPRNGTAVIGCAPCERTSLNYTSMKCALEDTDDVVVHYRYYPDRTYKFVSELDPDREVCEHWNPCQIGYIFSLPGPDQATLATELWPISEYVHDSDEEMAREEIIPPIPEDDRNETWLPAQAYETSARKVVIPDGYNYDGVGRWESTGKKRISLGAEMLMSHILVISDVGNNSVKIKIKFNPLKMSDARTYYARMAHKERPHKEKKFYIPLVTINFGRTHMNPQVLHVLPGQKLNTTSISFTCDKCTVTGVMVRGDDDSVSNLDGAQYRVRKYNDDKGVEQSIIEIDFDEVQPKFFGDYFLMIQNEDGSEEKVRALTVIQASSDPENKIKVDRKVLAAAVGEQHDLNVKYTCDDCELTEILCRGESVLNQGRFTIIPTSKEVSVRFVGFEDSMSCVYMGIFKAGDTVYGKSLVILENSSPSITVPKAPLFGLPQMGEQFEHKVTYECSGDCKVDKITVNGVPLVPPPSTTRRSGAGSTGFYAAEDNTIAVRVTEFSMPFVGLYQATFSLEGENITKNLLEIGYPYHADGGGLSADSDAGSETTPSSSSEDSVAGSETTPSSSEAPGGDSANEASSSSEDPNAGSRRKGPAKH